MSRTTYAPIESYIGTGALAVYTFSFKIEELAQLLVVEFDDAGLETQRVRGTDVTYLTGVVFDSVDGGGTVTLAANLTTDYTLKLLLANDAPTQSSEYRDKASFNLKSFELALDFQNGAVMRNSYQAQRSVKLSDYTLLSAFDPTLPIEVTDATSQSIVTNATGTGFEIGPSLAAIVGAAAAAVAAAASAVAAAASAVAAAASAAAALVSENAAAASAAAALVSENAAAASAAAAAASVAAGWTDYFSHAITGGQAATALAGETWDATLYNTCVYEFSIIRGTTINANGQIVCQLQNGSWKIVLGSYAGDVHGVTFSLTGTTTQQLNAAVGAGSNGTINLSSRLITV